MRSMLRALITFTVPALTLTLLPPSASAAPSGGIANVAHRGASDHAPENTVPAMVEAVADRADFVGIDIRLTSDGVPVVVHDATLRRTTNAEELYPGRSPWAVEQLTFAEISRLDAGSWKAPGYQGTHVPSLSRLLTELGTSGTGIFLEVKNPDRYGGSAGIGRATLRVLRRHQHWAESLQGLHDDLVLQSFDWRFLRRLHLRAPAATYGLLGEVSAKDLEDHPFAHQVNLPYETATADRVDNMHQREVSVAAFTATTTSIMQGLIQVGVDAIVANDPALLHDQLAQRGVARERSGLDPDGLAEAIWTIDAPERARIGSHVKVRARLLHPDGSPVAWQWAEVQRRTADGWRTLRERATAADGTLWAMMPAAPGYRVRLEEMPRVAARQATTLYKARTSLVLDGPEKVRRGDRARLTVRWTTRDGTPVTGEGRLQVRKDGRWVYKRTIGIRDGRRSVLVTPRRDTTYRLVGVSGRTWAGDNGRHRVEVRGR